MATKPANPFDFENVEDLPEELQKAVTSRGGRSSGGYVPWVDVLKKGKEAGFDSLTLGQIKGAAHRLGMKIPSDQTLRKHFDDALKAGLIEKPTRQTYSAVDMF